ncbi:Hypothetical protein CINCED_3A013982 [Cinara cedri]|uniref:Reverse transcriptase domain n=1 Tax=Cinara cedri TaxID=506608 RepID=A0A5E4M7U3_9HEMI|nr:Hypothetical protein CINCED_3A013982 [Cinara cedri]
MYIQPQEGFKLQESTITALAYADDVDIPERKHLKRNQKSKTSMGWICYAKTNHLIRMIMDENPVGKRPLGRPRLRWEDVIRKDVETLVEDGIEKQDRWIGKDGGLDM